MNGIRSARIELSAGGVIFRQLGGAVQVLLIKDSYDNWGFPKGHIEAGESSLEAALRECREETGLERLTVVAELGASDWYFRSAETLVHKFCDYFLLEADPEAEARPQHSEGIDLLVWLPPEGALQRVTYANARHMLELSLDRLPKPSRASSGPVRGK